VGQLMSKAEQWAAVIEQIRKISEFLRQEREAKKK